MRIYPGDNNKLMKDKLIVATIQEYLNTQVNCAGGNKLHAGSGSGSGEGGTNLFGGVRSSKSTLRSANCRSPSQILLPSSY